MDFQDQKDAPAQKVARNPNNYNILKGGQVDPGSKMYQRSVAGREQLKDYLNRLWNSGMDEADVFMAGVKSLMNRGHGYVGAYLDSKNPGRRYEQNQAMAITDQVMTDEGIGEHPGNRLTRPKVEDEEGNIDKEATKAAREERKMGNQLRGQNSPQLEPGRKAMPVGQQRKLGKRESTGEPVADSVRPGRAGGREGSRAVEEEAKRYQQPVRTGTGETEFYNREQVKKTLEDRLNGKATTEDVLAAYQSTYQKPLSDSPRADAERRRKRAESRDRFYTTGSGKMPEGEKKPAGGGAQPPSGGAKPSGAQPPTGEAAPAQPPTSESKPPAEAPGPEQPEEKTKWRAPGEGREDTGVVEEVKTGVAGASGGMLSAQSRPVIGPWARDEKEYKKSITSVFDRFIKEEVEAQYEGLSGARDPRRKKGIESKIYSDPKELEYVIKDTIRDFISKDKNLQGTDFDDFARDHLNKLIAYRTGQETAQGPETPAAAPQPKAAPDRQAPTTDEDFMRRATLMSGKTAAPGDQESAGPAPSARQPLPEEKLGRGRKRGPRSVASGFTPEAGKAAMDTIRQAANSGKTPQEVMELFKQGELFGGAGLETGSAATNPLEGGSTPTPTESPEEFAPSSKLPGAGGPTPETAKAGQPGQQGLFRSGTTTPRTGSGFGKPQPPAPPSGPVETPQDRAKRMKELTDSGMSSDVALKQMEKEGTVKTRTEGGKGRVRRAPEQGQKPVKRTPVMDDVVRGAGNISRGIGNAFNKARERHNKSVGGKFFQVSEQDGGTQMSYEEFAQSVRSLLR